jgi:hypothetical protein
MPSFLLAFYNPFPLFMSWFFLADVCSICLFVFLISLIIKRQSESMLQKNSIYNKDFLKFRTEVYANYEKNFFVG